MAPFSGATSSRLLTQPVSISKEDGKITFFAAWNVIADAVVTIKVNGHPVADLVEELQPSPTYARMIWKINELVGSPFLGSEEPPTNLSIMSLHPVTHRVLMGSLDMALRCAGVRYLDSLLFGLMDGLQSGFKDDRDLFVAIKNGTVVVADNFDQETLIKILKYSELAPFVIAQMVSHVYARVEEGLRQYAAEQSRELAKVFDSNTPSAERAEIAYRHWRFASNPGLELTKVALAPVGNAIGAWFDDFAGRMSQGAEKKLLDDAPLRSAWPDYFQTPQFEVICRESYYTLGYVFGYLAEQTLAFKGASFFVKEVAMGARGSMAAIPACKDLVKRIAPQAQRLISETLRKSGQSVSQMLEHVTGLRTTLVPAVEGAGKSSRLRSKTFLPQAFANTADDAVSVAERAAKGLGPVAPVVTEGLETARRSGAPAIIKILEDAVAAGRAVPGGPLATVLHEAPELMYQRLGHLHHLLGEARASDNVATNLMRYWEKKLLLPEKKVLETGEIVYDWYGDFVRAFHAHSPGATFALDQIDDQARNMLAIFGKTEKGWIWKVGFDGPAPRGNFARGNIIELDLFYNGDYKGFKYLDIGNSGPYEPVDFSLGSVLVQETSTAAKVENRITSMGEKLDKLARQIKVGIDEGSATKGVFDVRVPDTGDISISDYVRELNIRARQAEINNGLLENKIEIIVKSYGSWLD